MIRKVLLFLFPAALGAVAALQWQEALRYIKIKQLSTGSGHPEVVPAEGKRSYPQDRVHAGQDGTGDFDSARRGGPALTA